MTEIETTDNSLTITRMFDASSERVFRAFTEPEDMEQWFGPGSMTGEVHALELEPGGAYAVSMVDGENRYDINGEFIEIVENERLVHTWEPGRVTIELRDVEEGCEVVLTHDGLPDAETVDGHADGWTSALDNLNELLQNRVRPLTDTATAETKIETGEKTLTIQRTFNAPHERVWKAVTEPDQVDQWWGPDGFSTTTDEMDVRPGGVWTFEMVGPEGETYPNQIVYNEVDPPERLTYTHGSPDNPDQFNVTMTFDKRSDDQTDLTMTMEFPTDAALNEAIEFGAADGARQTLDKLVEYLSNG